MHFAKIAGCVFRLGCGSALQVASDMQLVLSPTGAALHIWLDLEAATSLQLDISAASVADALVMVRLCR
jgi:hypothetical protein